MLHTSAPHSLKRVLGGLLLALALLAFFSIFPRAGHAQATTSALPHVTTTPGMLDAMTAASHPRVITLSGASSLPLVHSSFAMVQPSAPPVASQSVQTLTQLAEPQGDGIYRYNNSQLGHSITNASTPPPVFSSPSGEYTGQLKLMLGGGSPQTKIYYTLNGAQPTTASTLYKSPLTLNASTTIKAIAITSGQPPSPVATAVYKIVQPSLTFDFGSNGVDSVEIFLNLNAPGAASLAGDWVLSDGPLILCRASLSTESTMRCSAKLNRGNHELKASYSGAVNGWNLATATTLRIE